tara:strand:+ start:371 stop:817 length:447 start_codon:yes stop_codon:yes gene_type:complete
LNALKSVINQPEVEADASEEVIESNKRSTPYTDDVFAAAWKKFIEISESQGKHQEALILKDEYAKEEHTITVFIANEALEPSFEKLRTDLLEYLRNELKNDHIQLRSVIKEIEKQKMLYTDKEKFEHLKRKYPALKDLQEKLGLDPEF